MNLHPRCCHHWKCIRICRDDIHRFSAGKAAKQKKVQTSCEQGRAAKQTARPRCVLYGIS